MIGVIPLAVFGVTLDPFIVYSSNVFAILGLRALFFALAFGGIKMLIVDLYKIPV